MSGSSYLQLADERMKQIEATSLFLENFFKYFINSKFGKTMDCLQDQPETSDEPNQNQEIDCKT